MFHLSHFYANNKNIFGRFYPHNKSYLGKSQSKQGSILLFWTKLYPQDNLNHDKNNKIQLLHNVLWTDRINVYPPHLCLQTVYPHEKFIIRLPSNISPPSDTLLGLFWSHIEIFWFISHSAHLAGELWNSIQDQQWDLQLLNVSILVRLCSQLWVYFSRLLDPWLHWPDTWGVQWINQRHTTPELRYGQTIQSISYQSI